MTAVVSVEVFAHIAPSLHFDGQTLTLVDLSPSTIRMSRPQPSAGGAPELDYLPTGAFLDRWTDRAREVGPAGCRMRGTLSLLDPDAQIAGRAVVELRAPRLTADGLVGDVGQMGAGIAQGFVTNGGHAVPPGACRDRSVHRVHGAASLPTIE